LEITEWAEIKQCMGKENEMQKKYSKGKRKKENILKKIVKGIRNMRGEG